MAFVPRQTRLQHFNPDAYRVDVQTNSFRMQFPTKVVHHYDVVIEPCWETKDDFKIGRIKGNELVMRVQSTYPEIFARRAAFDGKKNLFAPVMYFPEQTFEDVSWTQNPDNDRKKRVAKVHMKHVNAIDFSILQRYVQTQQLGAQGQNEVNLILNMLNVFVQATPKQKAGILASPKSIFVKSEREQPRGIAPLELWRGYFQSVRPAFDRLLVNVDVTIGVVLPAAELENVCADFLRVKNRADLRRLRPDQFQKLRQFLKGVKIQISIGKHKAKPPKVIKDLIQDVGASTFDRAGETVTVAQHFKELYNLPIPPSTLGVKIQQRDIFPILCCSTVEQLYKNRATPEVVRAALEFTPSNPSQRAMQISKAFSHFDYSNSGFLINAGIHVDERPELIKGRMLATPIILFDGTEKHLNQRPGVWDVMRQRLAKPAAIRSWIVVDFANVDSNQLHYFIKELIGAMIALGLQVSDPAAVERRPIQADVFQDLAHLRRQHNPSLIIAILPDPAESQYRKIKRFGDITEGVATQCVRWSNNLSKNVGLRKVNQYQNNLILKINPKLGGTNFTAKSPVLVELAKNPFMIIGADVSHPGPGSQLPSIASMVGSYEQGACRYAASIRVQSSRVEMIEEFAAMFHEILHNFRTKNSGHCPLNIVVFRDGVSEGEFENVNNHEYAAMNSVIKAVYPEGKRPKIVYLVVGKRHHIRFFPRSPNQGDNRGNGNFPSGLVVDSDIVHPRFCDFYLQSQPGLKGTSIPSHYTILRNEIGIPMAQLQDLAYSLCHSYARSTRSVKIPAPVYYADLVCRRAKFHFDDSIHDYSASSVSGDDDMSSHLDYYRQHFSPVNNNFKDQMYFL